nr:prolyl oligopeptidase family serine peptidase [Pseudoalteromonas sp. H100]
MLGVSDLSRINATLNENRFLSILQRPTISGVSPVEQVEKVNVPILVIHGDIDSRVPVKHSRDFVSELEKYKKTLNMLS